MPNYEQEKQQLRNNALLPIIFVTIIWIIKIIETYSNIDLGNFLGVYPRTLSGLKGIVGYPLVHGNWEHLFSNTMPLLVLGFLFMNSYRVVAKQVLPIIYLGGGLGLWLIGRPANHIGASGLVYGLAFFLFFSGLWRKDRSSMALAAFVAFFYGGMTWGLYPIEEQISWEGHLSGAVVGIVCAYLYRHINPAPRYDWENQPAYNQNEPIIEHPFWVPLPPDEEIILDNEDNTHNNNEGNDDNDDNNHSNKSSHSISQTTDTPSATRQWEIKYHFVPHPTPPNDTNDKE